MCDDWFSWWFRQSLNFVSGAVLGCAVWTLRKYRRELREIREMRATVETNLQWSAFLLGKLMPLAGDDDDPPAPTLTH